MHGLIAISMSIQGRVLGNAFCSSQMASQDRDVPVYAKSPTHSPSEPRSRSDAASEARVSSEFRLKATVADNELEDLNWLVLCPRASDKSLAWWCQIESIRHEIEPVCCECIVVVHVPI
jgi:hypothetical protein